MAAALEVTLFAFRLPLPTVCGAPPRRSGPIGLLAPLLELSLEAPEPEPGMTRPL